jgi:hypothetical protein
MQIGMHVFCYKFRSNQAEGIKGTESANPHAIWQNLRAQGVAVDDNLLS